MNDPTPPLPDPEQLQKVFQKWWATGASIVGTITSALSALKIPSPWATGIAAALAGIGLILTIVLYRKQVQRHRDQIRNETELKSDQQRTEGAAFRGLRRFRAGEKLPGAARRRVAASLLTEVQRPSFELAIVTGDSGAGKSSLLECALIQALEGAGYVVEFISNLGAQLPLEKLNAQGKAAALATIWSDIRSRVEGPGRPVILILDQFEELLSRLPLNARDALGDTLQEALAEKWRVVIGLRKEFLAELKEVAARLGRPLSLQDVFILRNFDVPEAAEVIRECAARDRIALDDELPDLIANDLAVDGTVRPPDLQIVCEALQGEMTVDRYRRERRAAGLRSRFIKDTADLTGDAVLARAVLRELCDIPNNKKRPDPVSAEAIAAKVRMGAPGDRATVISVGGVLESLRQSYVVVRVRDEVSELWSLIHDYMVEPIKIATEEQVTRTEAAAAELDYFLSRAASGNIKTIPLPRLKEIKGHAPPAQLSQYTARRLIRRSMIIGYGKPTALVLTIAVTSVLSVILLAADWNVWRPYGMPLSHWEATGRRDRTWIHGELLNDGSSRILVTGDGFSEINSRVAIWDTNSGERIGTRSGSISVNKGAIWSYDKNTGHLSRLIVAPGNVLSEDWVRVVPALNRPPGALAVIEVIGEPPRTVVFQGDSSGFRNIWRATLDVKSNTWTTLSEQALHPTDEAASGSQWYYSDSSKLFAVLLRTGKRTRLTVYSRDFTQTVLEEQFDTASVSMLGLLESADTDYVSVAIDQHIETIPIRKRSRNGGTASVEFEPLAHLTADLPRELKWNYGFNTASNVFSAAQEYLLVDSQQTGSVLWPFDPVASTFGDPIISSAPVPAFHQHDTLSWSPKGKKGTMIWPANSTAPSWAPHLEVQSTDRLTLSSTHTRILLVHDDSTAELWAVDLQANTDHLLTTIDISNPSRVEMSEDGRLVIARQEGGILHGWSLEGKYLGTLGSIGSDVIWLTYEPTCERIFLWTGEGQRLQWRLGTAFPFQRFRPVRACPADRGTR